MVWRLATGLLSRGVWYVQVKVESNVDGLMFMDSSQSYLSNDFVNHLFYLQVRCVHDMHILV